LILIHLNTYDIIKDCKRGDGKAFGTLVDLHADMAFRVALRIMNDEMEAEDMVQEAYISAWKNMKDFDAARSFSSWLYRIVVNKCYDALRSRKRTRPADPNDNCWKELSDAADNPEVSLDNKETAHLIKMLSETLSPKQKLVFILIDLEGLTHDEVKEITGMRKMTVKKKQFESCKAESV